MWQANNIKRIDAHEYWSMGIHLIDTSNQASFKRLPFEHFTVEPKYQITLNGIQYLYSIYSPSKRDDSYKGLGHFKIVRFNAQKSNIDYHKQKAFSQDWFKGRKLKRAFDESYPLLKKFLKFICRAELNGAKLYLEKQLNEKLFWTFKQKQLHHIQLHLSGGGYNGYIYDSRRLCKAFGMNSVEAVKLEIKERIAAKIPLPRETEETLWFDLDTWLEDSSEEEIKALAQGWLKPNAPLEMLREQIYDQYLSGEKQLPSEAVYLKKYTKMLEPYFRQEENKP